MTFFSKQPKSTPAGRQRISDSKDEPTPAERPVSPTGWEIVRVPAEGATELVTVRSVDDAGDKLAGALVRVRPAAGQTSGAIANALRGKELLGVRYEAGLSEGMPDLEDSADELSPRELAIRRANALRPELSGKVLEEVTRALSSVGL